MVISRCVRRSRIGPTDIGPTGSDKLAWDAQNRQVDAGGKLCKEEVAKREANPIRICGTKCESMPAPPNGRKEQMCFCGSFKGSSTWHPAQERIHVSIADPRRIVEFLSVSRHGRVGRKICWWVCRCHHTRELAISRDWARERRPPARRPVPLRRGYQRFRRRQHSQRHRVATIRNRYSRDSPKRTTSPSNGRTTSSTIANSSGCPASSTLHSTGAARFPHWKIPTTSAFVACRVTGRAGNATTSRPLELISD